MTEDSRKILCEELAKYYGLHNRVGELVEEGQALSKAAMKMYRLLDKTDDTRRNKEIIVGRLINEIAKLKCGIDQVLYLFNIDEDHEIFTRCMDRAYENSNRKMRNDISQSEEEE